MITLEVLGTPAPKGSSRAFVNKRTGRAIVAPSGSPQNKANLRSWNLSVREAALEAIGLGRTEPVFVAKPLVARIEFRLPRPAGHYSKATGKLLASAPVVPITKPDVDKLARATLDSLKGLAYDDDSRIVDTHPTKVYAQPGREGAWIEIFEWSELGLRRHVSRILVIARKVAEHWRAQDGVNGALLDELADAFAPADLGAELAAARHVGDLFAEATK